MSQASLATQAKRQSAHYMLRLHVGSSPFAGPVPGVANYRNGELALPLAPQSVKLEARARTHVSPLGNRQVADEHGVTPPDITIAGTFGQTAFGIDPLQDGRAWQRELETIVRWYLQENYRRGTNREQLLAMSWHDTYRGEHWYVTPSAVPYGEQDASNPYRERYTMRLTGLRDYGEAPPAHDELAHRTEPDQHAEVLVAPVRVLEGEAAEAERDDMELRRVRSHYIGLEMRQGRPDHRIDRIHAMQAATTAEEIAEVYYRAD